MQNLVILLPLMCHVFQRSWRRLKNPILKNYNTRFFLLGQRVKWKAEKTPHAYYLNNAQPEDTVFCCFVFCCVF